MDFCNKDFLIHQQSNGEQASPPTPIGKDGDTPHQEGWGTPHSPDGGIPPPHRCEQTENITFRHPSDAVGSKRQ